ncbi:hypothetical protein GGI11_003885 [Coemansia sp. RSA 2049]|nr:hypothetical protein GGI11_003885 [Coemansia sp. RSA 2049]
MPPAPSISIDYTTNGSTESSNDDSAVATDTSSYQQQTDRMDDGGVGYPNQFGGNFIPPANRRPLFNWPIEPPTFQQQQQQQQKFPLRSRLNVKNNVYSNPDEYWPISVPSDLGSNDRVADDNSLESSSQTESQEDNQQQQEDQQTEGSGPTATLPASESPVINNPSASKERRLQPGRAADPSKTNQITLNKTENKPRREDPVPAAPSRLRSPRAPPNVSVTVTSAISSQPTAPPLPAIKRNQTDAPASESLAISQPPLRGANGVMRIARQPCYTETPAIHVPGVSGEIRQQPASGMGMGMGMGMGYHGHSLVRGVNIGGFLVPEFWITPSLIADIPDPKPNDYLQLCKRLGQDAALKLMRNHWEKWVTESEVQRLANAGITHLRIPVGHWEFVDTDEGYVRGGLPFFKRLVYWANQNGMRVIPDMHTAPGSQNGFDNSGTTGGINWTNDPQNVALSKRALQNMLRFLSSDPIMLATVDAIDLLNEPFIDSLDFAQLWEYDTGGHTLVSSGLHRVPPVISIVDRGFKEYAWWQSRWPRDWNSKYIDAWLDAHLYHVFDRNIDNWPLESHLRLVCNNGRDLKSNSTIFPIIVGEWSLALPQAALNGRENEARRRFAEAQLDAYDQGGAGWIFWCFKTEASPEWSFLDALDRSWLPQPLSNREFPQVCGH